MDLIAAAKARKLQSCKVTSDKVQKNPAFLKCQFLEANRRVFTKVEAVKPKQILNTRPPPKASTALPPNPYALSKVPLDNSPKARSNDEEERIKEFKNTEFLNNDDMDEHMERRRKQLVQDMKNDIEEDKKNDTQKNKTVRTSNKAPTNKINKVMIGKNGKVIPQNYAALYKKAQNTKSAPPAPSVKPIEEPAEIDEAELEGLTIDDSDLPALKKVEQDSEEIPVNEEDDA